MSILIKGMEMPQSGYVDVRLFSDGRATTQTGEHPFYREMDIIEVPPHGRLIDADELIEKQKEDAEIFMGSTNYGDKVRYDEAMNAVANIVNAPTVIPTDKDGET